MSFELWKKLPSGFLKKRYPGWCNLDHDVKLLVVELANRQKFKCALCTKSHSLVIEHDHYPEKGLGRSYTIYNVRGLVCVRCNNDLSVYERQENGDYFGFENVESRISSRDYGDYIYFYRNRVEVLHEALREKRMGPLNYWKRKIALEKFDDWHSEGGSKPSWWIKYKKNEVRTPGQAIRIVIACMRYVIEQLKKNPEYQPPEIFFELISKFQLVFEEAKANRVSVISDSVPATN